MLLFTDCNLLLFSVELTPTIYSLLLLLLLLSCIFYDNSTPLLLLLFANFYLPPSISTIILFSITSLFLLYKFATFYSEKHSFLFYLPSFSIYNNIFSSSNCNFNNTSFNSFILSFWYSELLLLPYLMYLVVENVMAKISFLVFYTFNLNIKCTFSENFQ